MSPNTAISTFPTRDEPVEPEPQQAIDQPTNTANQQESENKQNADQPELVFSLTYSTRDQLIITLNQLSAILQCNTPIPEDAKQRTCKKIGQSIRLLVELSPLEPTPCTEASVMFEETIFGQLTFKLSRVESSRMLNHLVAIRDAVQFEGLTTGETKHGLVTESRRFIDQLLDLPVREGQSGKTGSARSEEDANEKNDEPSVKQRVESEISSPNKELDWKAVIKSQGEQIASLQATVDGLKSELKQRIQEVDTSRAEASFKFELAGIYKLFATNGSCVYSETFWCRGLQWSLCGRSGLVGGAKYLSFYLNCCNDDKLRWSCKTTFNLILFSNLPENPNYVKKACYTYQMRTGYGNHGFISYDELNDQGSYIKDDRIVLGVELKAGQVVRED